MRWRVLFGVLAVLTLAVVVLGWKWSTLAAGRSKVLKLPGVVEIQEVRLASKQGGRVKQLEVAEGQWVEKDQELLIFEAPELRAKLAQLEAQRNSIKVEIDKANKGSRLQEIEAAAAAADAAAKKWERLKKGFRDEEVKQAESDFQASQADLTLAEEELARAVPLFRKRMISPSEYDQYQATYQRAQSHASTLKTKWQMMKNGGWEPEIKEAEALAKQAAANLELLKVSLGEERRMLTAKMDQKLAEIDEVKAQLAESTIRAPARAIIDVLPVRKGDVLAPNQTVARILKLDDLWVKIFVPETEVGKVRLGQAVEVTVDAYPGRRFQGTIYYIASQSEFTPRNVQSIDERRHQVFGIRVRVTDPAAEGVLKSGLAATVYVPLAV
ncbi:MAG TPA: efflux RND transporter periplasmic adaptor subunit [Isosphaeraceae bacterium]|nr:efflux RND transporter periplasmic adaptor subunit [Isosphaeraceae bacterium]